MPINVTELQKVGRINRRPQHVFQLQYKPWVIQPFMIAPVLPGETLRQALIQCRAVTDPIKNPVIGWWFEMYLFYVKLTDLTWASDTLVEMLLSQGTSVAALATAAQTETYHNGGGLDYTEMCLRRVTECYFRDEDEAWNVATIGDLPLAKVSTNRLFIDSLIDGADLSEGGSAHDGTETLHELDRYLDTYEFMRQQQLTNLSYEDWLKQYGVRTNRIQQHKPELIRYVRDWSYPANTVDASTGVPTSAVSWAIAERADKDRYFTEPGFLFGVTVVRPKVYFSKLTGACAHFLDEALYWLPAILQDRPETSLREFAYNAGPVRTAAVSGSYWLDMRDLFIHGDQFLNFTPGTASTNPVVLPEADWDKEYPAEADIDAQFVSGTSDKIKVDGVCSLTISGTQADNT